jgi:hypothetical protein
VGLSRAFSEGKIMGHCHLYEYINGKSSFVDGVIYRPQKRDTKSFVGKSIFLIKHVSKSSISMDTKHALVEIKRRDGEHIRTEMSWQRLRSRRRIGIGFNRRSELYAGF